MRCSEFDVVAVHSRVQLMAVQCSRREVTKHAPDLLAPCNSRFRPFIYGSSDSCSLPAAVVRACAAEPDVFMLSSAPPMLAAQPPQPSSKSVAIASPDASWEGSVTPGGGGATSCKSAQEAATLSGNSGEPQLMDGWDAGTASSWDSDAVAAADPFATVHAPDRLFRLSAAPAAVLGLQQCSDGRLQLAENDRGASQPATSSAAAQQLLRQLAAAAAAPSWPPCSVRDVDADPTARSLAATEAGGDAGVPDHRDGMCGPQLQTAVLQAAAAKPGTSTGWGDGGSAEPEAAAARQQEAGEADPAAPGTPQRGDEHRSHSHAAAAASDAQGLFGSPLPMRMLPAQPAADGRADVAPPSVEASVQLVKVDEAALVQTALLALQVNMHCALNTCGCSFDPANLCLLCICTQLCRLK